MTDKKTITKNPPITSIIINNNVIPVRIYYDPKIESKFFYDLSDQRIIVYQSRDITTARQLEQLLDKLKNYFSINSWVFEDSGGNSFAKAINNINTNEVILVGKKYEIKVILNYRKSSFEIIGNKIYLKLQNKDKYKEYLLKALDELFLSYIIKKMNYYTRKYEILLKAKKERQFDYQKTRLYNVKTYLGICRYHEYKIDFAYKLLFYKLDDLHKVILHELCHLIYAHHRKPFYDLLDDLATKENIKSKL